MSNRNGSNGSNGTKGTRDTSGDSERLRHLPSIDRLLNDPAAQEIIAQYGRDTTRDAFRKVLDVARQWVKQGNFPPEAREIFWSTNELLTKTHTSTLRSVINATGVIIHTNLGRAPLSEAAQQAILAVAGGYSTLEFDLEAGERGKRDSHIETLVTEITGAESALVVNNNAAAVILMLSALAKDREVIISRGQLVEIGGGFRVPDVMLKSGAKLVEVGTTNKTHADDFRDAITPQTALLMRAHASNFKQLGFTEQPALAELAQIAHKASPALLVVDDLGSGALLDTALYGLAHEPTVQESIRAGIDLVAFSGDKLLGGPQAGIIAGKKSLIALLKKHPLARAVRLDKLSLAGLVATLEHYRTGTAIERVPIWRMITMPAQSVRERAEAWLDHLGFHGGEIIATESTIGGGSLPGETLPSFALALAVSAPDEVAAKLRRQALPVITRIAHDRVLLDPRTVLPTQDEDVFRALHAVLG